MFWKTAVRELLWFLSGATSIVPLVAQGVHIWTDWPLQKFVAATGEALTRDAFEARLLGDAGSPRSGATSARSMGTSGGTGRAFPATKQASISSLHWSTDCGAIRRRGGISSPAGTSPTWAAWRCRRAT